MSNNQELDFENQGGFELPESDDIGFNKIMEMALSFAKSHIPIILFGPPGTGKSYIVDVIRQQLTKDSLLDSFEVVQFHKKFSYEDFIEGFVPGEGGSFVKKDGCFKSFCKNVKSESNVDLFVIDEMNRAELSTTLGEMLYLIEDRENRKVKTSHFAEDFSIPTSVSIVGTMNTADRNISGFDYAIRRRFRFIPVFPDYEVLKEILLKSGWNQDELGIEVDSYVKACSVINSRVASSPIMGRHMELGHMMFVPNVSGGSISKNDLVELFYFVIIPQLEAYCGFGNEHMIEEITSNSLSSKYLNFKSIDFQDIADLIISLSNSKEND